MSIYVVQPEDTVFSIADAFHVSTESILWANQLIPPYTLAIGQALFIPSDASLPSGFPARINGYAYPFISEWVLSRTLPFLSVLSVFSYGFTENGHLIPPPLNDNFMILAANASLVSPVLTLTPLDATGRFNNFLIHSVVSSLPIRNQLINELLNTVQTSGFSGVDVDFEYILKEDRDHFTAFVTELTEKMNAYGYEVSVALAPKTSPEQTGLLYEGKDYAALGKAANHVLLMTYEWGYKYGPNMAVAPLNLVRRVVTYAVTQISPDKISLGIPNYGYDWPLPFVKDSTIARTIGNVEAVQIAVANHAKIQFDETAMSPFFQYISDGILHEVWFEDVRSIQAKINLMREFQLEGAGYWQINQLFLANWLLLNQEVVIQKNT